MTRNKPKLEEKKTPKQRKHLKSSFRVLSLSKVSFEGYLKSYTKLDLIFNKLKINSNIYLFCLNGIC